jgi:chromosome partitioning protein
MNTTTIAISIANQKGGVAKTTTAAAMAAGLTQKGYKVLAVDMDPQGNLSDSSGAEMYQLPTSYELLKRAATASEVIQHLNVYDVIPSNIMLASVEQELLTQTGKEYRLKETLASVHDLYDFIIIDTPPSLGVLTVNSLTCANEVIIPTTAGIFAANGIKQLCDTITNIKQYCNRDLEIAGILLTKFNPRTTIGQELKDLTEEMGEHLKTEIFQTFIRSSIIVEEAQANKIDLFTYKAASTVAEDYNAFIDEYLTLKGKN